MNKNIQLGEISPDGVNGRQLGYIIINTLMGSGVYLLPSLLSNSAGHDGWLLAILGTAVPIIYTILICAFFKRSQMSFKDTAQDMMGKAGWAVRAAYAFLHNRP